MEWESVVVVLCVAAATAYVGWRTARVWITRPGATNCGGCGGCDGSHGEEEENRLGRSVPLVTLTKPEPRDR